MSCHLEEVDTLSSCADKGLDENCFPSAKDDSFPSIQLPCKHRFCRLGRRLLKGTQFWSTAACKGTRPELCICPVQDVAVLSAKSWTGVWKDFGSSSFLRKHSSVDLAGGTEAQEGHAMVEYPLCRDMRRARVTCRS